MKGAGWVDPTRLPKGPNGRARCRRCGREVEPPRRTFCSDGCVEEWKVRSNPGYARARVFDRDRGVCRACGLDTVQLVQRLRLLRRDVRRVPEWRGAGSWYTEREMWRADDPLARQLRQLHLPRQLWRLTRTFWEMDHVVPVVEGGGACGLDNLRTLCWACHARATRELMGRRARRQQLELVFPFESI